VLPPRNTNRLCIFPIEATARSSNGGCEALSSCPAVRSVPITVSCSCGANLCTISLREPLLLSLHDNGLPGEGIQIDVQQSAIRHDTRALAGDDVGRGLTG
jgi:hypothetical protein